METKNEKTEKMPNNRVVLLSIGRYNPPTLMHFRMFEKARDHLHSLKSHTVVGGIISPVHDHGTNTNVVNSAIRCDLLKLALQSSNWIRLSTWGVQDDKFKSIIEILKHHQNVLDSFVNNGCNNNEYIEDEEWTNDIMKNHFSQAPVQIKLLGGSDLLKNLISSEHYSECDISELLETYGLVVISRDGNENLNKLIYESDILTKYAHKITIVTEWIPTEINSSRIRRALKCGESVKYLLDNKVAEAIYKHSIYDAKIIRGCSDARRMDPSKSSTGGSTEASSRVILMSCGSYNPPTHMHLRMFERARDHLHNLGTHVVVGGVISPVNDAYGKKDLASSVHRCAMLKLALQDSDWIKLSTWEMRQSAWTRSRASLQHHQELLDAVVKGCDDANMNTISNEDLDWVPDSIRNNEANEQTPVRIKLLCGGDLLESFATPGLWVDEDIIEIVGQYGLIVITREGSNPYKFIYDSDILTKHLHNIQIVTEWIPNEVSSTRIRRALKRGESVKYLLQDAVIDYVYANGIYGADRPSTIKLDSLSTHSSTDFLNTDDAKYQDNAFLTPSPSDITMLETCPNAADATTMSEDLPDSIVNKNVYNTSTTRVSEDNSSTSNSGEDTELAREKFFRSINDSLNIGGESSSSLLQLSNHIFSQITSPIELPSSARARNELLAFEDTTESELGTLCDNTYSEDREDILSITYEESSDDFNETSIKNNKHNLKGDNDNSEKAEDTSTTKDAINESLSYDNLDDTESQETKFESTCEIDGKYHKSVVSSKKSLKKVDEGDDSLSNVETSDLPKDGVRTHDKLDTIEEKVSSHMEKDKKNLQDDLSYIKRLRLIVNEKQSNQSQQRQQLQGSLDSINQNEMNTSSNNEIESISKKSKSFESIKRNVSSSYKPSEITGYEAASNFNSETTSQMVTAPEFNTETDEFCTTCCFATNNEQPSSADVFYTIHSNCSSPVDEDSTECDICSSCNLRDSEDLLDEKQLIMNEPLCEETEICEICGEPASSTEDLLREDPKRIYMSARPMPLNLPKAKSTIEISKGSYRRSYYDDDHFEIDNCGLQDCRLRASLDTCNKPEPLYVNLLPRNRQFVSAYESRKSSNYTTDQPYSESEYSNRVRGYNRERRYIEPTDETSVPRSMCVGGKRLSRKGSYAKKSVNERPQEKRRYSSVDNLQNRMSFKSTDGKFSKSRENRFMTSADCIRPARIGRSRSLRRSADNVGRFDSSGDNLDSLEENVNTDENGAQTGDSDDKVSKRIKDNDTIKMILTKHGIKVISQKETVL